MNTLNKLCGKIRETRKLVRTMQNMKMSGQYKYPFKEMDNLAEKLIDLQNEVEGMEPFHKTEGDSKC